MNAGQKRFAQENPEHEYRTRGAGKDYRCPVCNRLLMRGKIIAIETRCPKCRKIVSLRDL